MFQIFDLARLDQVTEYKIRSGTVGWRIPTAIQVVPRVLMLTLTAF